MDFDESDFEELGRIITEVSREDSFNGLCARAIIHFISDPEYLFGYEKLLDSYYR